MQRVITYWQHGAGWCVEVTDESDAALTARAVRGAWQQVTARAATASEREAWNV